MKILAVLTLATMLLTGLPTQAAKPPAPIPAEDFDIADHAGRVILVDFWASWCPPCVESMPWLSRMASTHGDEGLTIVAINVDRDLKDAAKMLAALDPGIVVVHDETGSLAKAYELEALPSAFVYDRTGTLRASHVGFLLADAGAKEAELVALLKEELPDAP